MRQSIIDTLTNINFRKIALSVSFCPLCDRRRVFLRLDANEISVRCLSCKATSVTLSLVDVLRQTCPNLGLKSVYELSSRGALVKFLKQASGSLTCSEYFHDITPGKYKNETQCQDVQELTYPKESFDVCTSTEVFEHVANDSKGFSEIYRVLKPSGVFVFTVPIDIYNKTVERAMLISGGEIKHFLPPEYHGDPLRSDNRVLAFRDYGYDILTRLLNSGFKRAELRKPSCCIPWGYTRPVIVAYREEASNNRLNSDPLLLRSASQ